MKQVKRFASVFLMGALVLGTTACDSFITVKDQPRVVAPYIENSSDEEANKKAILNVINSYYIVLEDESNYDVVYKAHNMMQELPEDQRIRVLKALPGMEYFDTSSEESIKASGSYVLSTVDYIEYVRGRFNKEPIDLKTVKIVVPEDAIKVYGDVAEINIPQADITVDGQPADYSKFTNSTLNMKKDSTGEWKIVVPEKKNQYKW